jgi:hypothetical protein
MLRVEIREHLDSLASGNLFELVLPIVLVVDEVANMGVEGSTTAGYAICGTEMMIVMGVDHGHVCQRTVYTLPMVRNFRWGASMLAAN